jgi:hypothetical protein
MVVPVEAALAAAAVAPGYPAKATAEDQQVLSLPEEEEVREPPEPVARAVLPEPAALDPHGSMELITLEEEAAAPGVTPR